MRLICPNCGAQYEVPPEAIPPAGREVQCSNCQHAWFERGSAPPPRLLDPVGTLPGAEGNDEEADDLADVRDAPPPRPRVDPEVTRILREEAQHEQAARAAEAGRAAAPPDPARAAGSGTVRRLQPRGDAEAPATTIRPERPERPDRSERPGRPARGPDRTGELDIDGLNATLRSDPAPRSASPRIVPAPPPPRRSGFARGFVLSLLLLGVLAALYALRPQITAALPASAAVLDPYAEAVDGGRDWLDRQVGQLLGAPAE